MRDPLRDTPIARIREANVSAPGENHFDTRADAAGIGAVGKGVAAGAITNAAANNAASAKPAKRFAAFDLLSELAWGGGSPDEASLTRY